MLNGLVAFFNRFSKWCHDLGTIVILPLMTVLITLDVAMRYLFNSPFSWGEELNGLLLFLVLFLSMTYTWDQHRHIRMEIVYVRLKGRWRLLADWLTGITGIIFFGLLAIQCLNDISYMIKTNEAGEEVPIPLWIFRAIAALISLIFVLKLMYYIAHARKNTEEEVKIEVEGVLIQKDEAHAGNEESEAALTHGKVAVQGGK